MNYSLKRFQMIALCLMASLGFLSWFGARAEHHDATSNLVEPEAAAELREALAKTLGVPASRLSGIALQNPLAQQAYVKGSNTDLNDSFGFSVAVSGDTVVVGAVSEAGAGTGINGSQTQNETSAKNAGSVYVFVRNGTGWTQQAYLKGSNTETEDQFGYSVAISGDTIVVGARSEASSATGIDGNQNNNSAAGAGAVYVFVRTGTTWAQQAYIKASNTDAGDQFGQSVAIAGDTLVVGAPMEDSASIDIDGEQDDESAENAGAAYIFLRSRTTWTQQAYVKASNTKSGDNFGQTTVISANTIGIGAPAEDSSATGIDGNQDDTLASEAGAVYVFERSGSGTVWAQQAYIKASNTDAGDAFGSALAISGNTLAVGALREASSASGVNGNQTDNSASGSGATYVFLRSGTVWSQQAYLKASNPGTEDLFGYAVALSGNTLVVGASAEDSNATGVNGSQNNNSASGSGAAYVFERNGAVWSQQLYLKASNTGVNDQFGSALALTDNTIVVGANLEDSDSTGINSDQSNNNATNAGSAYIFAAASTGEPTISKAFNPTSITSGESSTVTLTLTNTQTIPLTGASFTDTLTSMTAVGGAVGGTCTGTTPGMLSAGATAVSFSGITIPASGSCTVTFAVTSDTPGTKTNQTSGLTTTQTPTAGSPSNIATLTVNPPASTPVVTITDPSGCTGPGDLLTVTVTSINPTPDAQTFSLTAALPATLTGVPNSGTSNIGDPPIVTATGITFSASLAANQTLTLTYQVQVGDAPSAASLCITTTSTSGGIPNPAVEKCIPVNCPPSLPFPAASEVSDQKAGSVLVFNLYSSSASSPSLQNTRVSLTNLNPSASVAVQLFFVDGATGLVTNATICLAKNQTGVFLVSDIDPGTTGYLIAVAADASTGCPVNFNFLTGSAFVKLASGHQAKLNAEAFAALEGATLACNATSTTAQLNFDGVSYNRAPRSLVLDTLAARSEGNDTILILNHLGGNLVNNAATLGGIFGVLYDDTENSQSFTFSPGASQFRSSFNNNFPRTTQRFDQFIPAGRSGWAKFYAQNDQGILGAALNFNASTGISSSAFSGGANLYTLGLTASASLIIPIFPPNCQVVVE